ncbi:uncharacterized protein CTHT_0007990 [Thermochaetoides thermophila DSM 1495]|uniref:C2H2-type domain-containing protein n=1 Tax=Chaetomium thermophilum (strain DSM 1495 / CBS 144.50 / IMI 039719) TaxID=759272 RepID=G0RZX7_CHATD|nr:hypothetical protein CTHT_0007990 [Thermochaetoides thermophila DSM 1495]EGS23138.1 hypothetical protein CTHT_0007990 [Thermochaetoides thermophila DSM 1495]
MQLSQHLDRAAARPERPPPLPARSVLVPRSTSLSSGATAGAVIGSVVGALLLALCLFPFIVRARRRWLTRHDDGAGLAEMGQSPGGPIADDVGHDHDGRSSSSKRYSKERISPSPDSALDTSPGTTVTTTPDHQQSSATTSVTATSGQEGQQRSASPDQKLGAASQGLPSPISPVSPESPTPTDGQAPLPQGTSVPHPLTATPSRTLSKGTVGQLSRSDSYAPQQITSTGITEEPESIDESSATPAQGRFPHLRDSFRNLISGRQSTRKGTKSSRKESKRSSPTVTSAHTTRSPSVLTVDLFPASDQSAVPAASDPLLTYDPNLKGLNWSYYNEAQALDAEIAEILGHSLDSTQPAPAFAPQTSIPTSVPLGPNAGLDTSLESSSMNLGLTAEPDSFLSDSGNQAVTTAPPTFGGQQAFNLSTTSSSAPQRSDTLSEPPLFLADLAAPPSLQYANNGPSGNPMDLMLPTNSTENAWRLEHEINKMIQNSPQMPLDTLSPLSSTLDNAQCGVSVTGPKPDLQVPFQTPYQTPSPYQSPLPGMMDRGSDAGAGMQTHDATTGFCQPALTAVVNDYTTPPPSNVNSLQNTPDTQPLPYPGSPSSQGDLDMPVSNAQPFGVTQAGFMPAPSQGLPPDPSSNPSSALSPSPAPAITISPGSAASLSPNPSARPSPAPSLGRSANRPEDGYICKYCGTVKSTMYEFNHHLRYHKRPFPCEYPGCDRSFGTITHLKRHINDRHCKTRRYFCTVPDCPYSRQGGKSFPRKDNWRRHMKNKHQIDPDTGPDADFSEDGAMDTTAT